MMQVYFIEQGPGGPIKIGSSGDVEGRLGGLQISATTELRLLASTEGDREMERGFHRQFRSARVRGEWFFPTAELKDVIRRINAGEKVTPKEPDRSGALQVDPARVRAACAHLIQTVSDKYEITPRELFMRVRYAGCPHQKNWLEGKIDVRDFAILAEMAEQRGLSGWICLEPHGFASFAENIEQKVALRAVGGTHA